MFAPSSLALTFPVPTAVFIGFAVGALSGGLTSVLLKRGVRLRSTVGDGTVGVTGFLMGFEIDLLIPWQDTTTYYVDHTLVTSTMNHYQHPYVVAFIFAILLPVLIEVWRFKKFKAAFERLLNVGISHDE